MPRVVPVAVLLAAACGGELAAPLEWRKVRIRLVILKKYYPDSHGE